MLAEEETRFFSEEAEALPEESEYVQSSLTHFI
jgi:hypothetical protein